MKHIHSTVIPAKAGAVDHRRCIQNNYCGCRITQLRHDVQFLFYRIRIKRYIFCLLLLSIQLPVHSSDVQAGWEYQWDNYITRTTTFFIDHHWNRNDLSGLLGIQYQNEGALGAIKGIVYPSLSEELTVKSSIHLSQNLPRFLLNVGIDKSMGSTGWFIEPLLIKLFPLQHFNVETSFGYRYGYLNGNSVVTSLHLPTHAWNASVSVRKKYFEATCAYEQKLIGAVDYASYKHLIEDSLFFYSYYSIIEPFINVIPLSVYPLPTNRIDRLSMFFYGPIFQWLYAGGYAEYESSKENMYTILAENHTSNTPDTDPIKAAHDAYSYDYFPYRTPMNYFKSGITLSMVFSPSALVNQVKLEAKLPIYSSATIRDFYVPINKNLLAGFESYDYVRYRLAPLQFKGSINFYRERTGSMQIHYSFFSEPYTDNSYFNSGLFYYYSTIGVTCKKSF